MILIGLTMTSLLAGLTARAADSCVAPPSDGTQVPVDVVAGRYFARLALNQGGYLRFYLDTGGGTDMLFPSAVRRLGLSTQTEIMGEDTLTWVSFPREKGDARFPPFPDPVMPAAAGGQRPDRLLIPPPQWGMMELGDTGMTVDGLLGPPWFAQGVWTLDYPNRRLFFHGRQGIAGGIPAGCWVPLGFQRDSTGSRTANYPRITAVIDGDSVDFLFDSGANTTLTDSAWRKADSTLPRHRATSFIIRSRVEAWHARHPDWPFVERAEQGTAAAMIQVPAIQVGGRLIGPVWFTERGDGSFHRFMSQWMDRVIDGALGGDAWAGLVVVLDYPAARAALLTPAP